MTRREDQAVHLNGDTCAVPLEKDAEAVIGTEERQIMNVLEKGFSDIESIHYLTGIDRDCISQKMTVLINFGWVETTPNGFVVARGERRG